MTGCPAGLNEKRGLLFTGLYESPQLKALQFDLAAGIGKQIKKSTIKQAKIKFKKGHKICFIKSY